LAPQGQSPHRPVRRGGSMSLPRSAPVLGIVLFLALAFPAKSALASGSGRLDRDVLPTSERLKLNLDARQKDYTGTAHIELSVKSAVDSFQFHSEGLKLKSVVLRGAKAIVPSTYAQSSPTTVTIHARSP